MCKISVVMSAYNAELYIAEAINSILQQTFEDFEFIILDNCSTDRTVDIIKQYNDNRIRFIQNEENLGIARSLNKGMELAKGEYIAHMDADDISYPYRLAVQVEYMDSHPNVCMCAGWNDLIVHGKIQKNTRTSFISPDGMRFVMSFFDVIDHATVMMRTEVLRTRHLEYDAKYLSAQDYELWIELLQIGELVVLDEKLVKCRIHEGNFSKNYPYVEREIREIEKKSIRYRSLTQDDYNFLMRAFDRCLRMPEEMQDLVRILLKEFDRCALSMGKPVERELLERAFYRFLSDYTYQGWRIYWKAMKTGVFRWNSIWGGKILLKSIINRRYTA